MPLSDGFEVVRKDKTDTPHSRPGDLEAAVQTPEKVRSPRHSEQAEVIRAGILSKEF